MVTELDRLIPVADFREVHSAEVAASPAAVDRAIRDVTLGEMPIVRLLFALRSLPTRLSGRRGLPTVRDRPLLAEMLDHGFSLRAELPGREVVVGIVGRPVGGEVEIAMNFQLSPEGDGTQLVTETRVRASSAASRRTFRPYWLLIRPWSGLIRRAWLRAITRRAQRTDGS